MILLFMDHQRLSGDFTTKEPLRVLWRPDVEHPGEPVKWRRKRKVLRVAREGTGGRIDGPLAVKRDVKPSATVELTPHGEGGTFLLRLRLAEPR